MAKHGVRCSGSGRPPEGVSTGSPPRITAVCPVLLREAARAQIMLASLDRFFCKESLQEIIVLCRGEERAAVAEALGDYPRRHRRCCVAEESLFGHAERELYWQHVPWYRQQLLKLAAHRVVATPHYLLLDADVVCCRQVSRHSLLSGKKAAISFERRIIHQEWWDYAARLLEFQSSASRGMSVTPEILHREVVFDLLQHLSRLHRVHWLKVLLKETWSEYTLYFTYLEKTGRVEEYYLRNVPVLAQEHGMNIWTASQFEAWRFERCASSRGFFVVCQGNTGIDPTAVWERVRHVFDEGAPNAGQVVRRRARRQCIPRARSSWLRPPNGTTRQL